MKTQANPKGFKRNKWDIGGDGQAVAELVQRQWPMDVEMVSKLMDMKYSTAGNLMYRALQAKRVAVQKVSLNDPYWYRPRGERAVNKNDLPHTVAISTTMIGFTLALRNFHDIKEASARTDAQLWGEWPGGRMGGEMYEIQPDKKFWIANRSLKRLYGTLEEETGKVRDEKFQRQRILHYWAWREQHCFGRPNPFGFKQFLVYYMAADNGWMKELQELTCKALATVTKERNKFFLYSSHKRWTFDTATRLLTEPIWQTAWGEPITLRELLHEESTTQNRTDGRVSDGHRAGTGNPSRPPSSSPSRHQEGDHH